MRVAWVVQVLASALAGAVWRIARRAFSLPPRIWHGPMPLHAIAYMVASDRAGGYPSRSCVVTSQQVKRYDLVTRSEFDRVVDAEDVLWHDRFWVALADLLLRGDVWVTYFDGLFFHVRARRRNEWAFRLIRAVGIRLIVTAHGSDIVQLTHRTTRYDWVGRMQRDYPNWSFVDQTAVSRERVEMFCRFADLVLPGDAVMARLLPRTDVLFKPFGIDCEALRPPAAEAPVAKVVTIIHAPNHRQVKGTDYLVTAVEQLQSRGFDCQLILIEGVARSEALQRYAAADIIADQFCMGGWAQFALEGMALGKPVLCYLDQEHLGDPLYNLPVVNAVPERIAEVLAPLIACSELRSRLGERSRAETEKYQSVPALGEVWDQLYRYVWFREPLRLETTEHFSSARRSRSFTEDPNDEAFWPVDVADLMPQIRDAIKRLRGGAGRLMLREM